MEIIKLTKFHEIKSSIFWSLDLDFILVDFNDFNLKDDILVIGNWLNDDQLYKAKYLIDKGARFIHNNLWERFADPNIISLIKDKKNSHIIFNGFYSMTNNNSQKEYYIPMFYWYTFMLRNKKYSPIKNNFEKKFLMLINNSNLNRDKLFRSLNDELKNAIFSYRAKNYFIENDLLPFSNQYVNVEWYEKTAFSLTVESLQQGNFIFLTEKTYKPISVGHPFIIFGNLNSLKLLKENGFKTYDTLFNEHYDSVDSVDEKINLICNEVKNFDFNKLKSQEEIILHNYNHFYNIELVKSNINDQILKPIKEFINAG